MFKLVPHPHFGTLHIGAICPYTPSDIYILDTWDPTGVFGWSRRLTLQGEHVSARLRTSTLVGHLHTIGHLYS
jgi:hypothetical protein